MPGYGVDCFLTLRRLEGAESEAWEESRAELVTGVLHAGVVTHPLSDVTQAHTAGRQHGGG